MTDAKARLLQMIADEPHMGGGGLLKAVGKAQKVAKAKKAAETMTNAYHGTNQQFDQFHPKWIGSATDEGTQGYGFYFTPNQEEAKRYGKNVIKATLGMSNPYVHHSQGESLVEKFNMEPKELTEHLTKLGYDSVISNYENGTDYLVFLPSQIKIQKAHGGAVHMAGGGKPKPTAEELAAMRAKQFPKFNIEDQMLGSPNQFIKDRANQLYPKKETMNPIVKAAKDKLDQFNAFIDRGVPVKELVGGLTGAIPFVGPKLRKDLEGATVDFPMGFERLPGNEQVATGRIETAPAKVSDILDSLKMSDLTGGTGASSVLNSVGKGYMPDPLDVLDAATLAIPAYGIGKAGVKAGVKGGRKAGKGVMATGRFVAPKAGLLAEQYMVNTGGILPLDVYHGSPHTFPPTARNPLGEFDASKIGTGEGAQVYGHGLYLAENRRVGDKYAGKLSKPFVEFANGSPENIYEKAILEKLNRIVGTTQLEARGDSLRSAFEEFMNPRMWKYDPTNPKANSYNKTVSLEGKDLEMAMAYKKAAERLGSPTVYDTGSLYKVDLPDEKIAKMLDWDKPMSEQQMIAIYDKMQQSPLASFAKPFQDNFYERMNRGQATTDGQDLFIELSKQLGGQKQVSDFLRSIDIPGIKYLDEGSRTAGQGTRNFVVFPGEEKDITILERNGQRANEQPRMAAGGAVSDAKQRLLDMISEEPHMAGGGRTPKYPWERYEQPKKVAEMRARQINPVAGAIKSGADYATQLIDKGPSFSSLVGGVVGAVPFVGPDMRKRMESSDIAIPTDITLGSNMPAEDYEYGQPMQYKKPGISTTSVPTKDVLEALKVSDLVGTPGLSNVAESIGYGQMPDPLDLLDAAGVGALGYGAVRAGAKGAKAAKQGALSAAKAAERFAEKKVPEVMERGGMGAQMLGAFGQNTASNVVKDTGSILPLMQLPNGLTRAEQSNLIKSHAENFAAKAKEMGLSASVEHSGSKAGPSSYVSISDPITGKKFQSPFRFSGHSKGPTQHQFVYAVGNDFSKVWDLLENMASSIPKAERDVIQSARQAKILEELALAEKEKLFSQGRPAIQRAMQEANLQQAPYTKAFSNSGKAIRSTEGLKKSEGGSVSNAKKRLLDMIYEEPHMAGGGLLKAVAKAQKTAKATKAAAKTVERIAAPQAEAMRLAQQRAALPVEQGGLGLLESNTAMDRAKAMGAEDVYHGTNAEKQILNDLNFNLDADQRNVGGIWTTKDKNYANWLADKKNKDSASVMSLKLLNAKNSNEYDILQEGIKLADEIGVPIPKNALEAQELLSGGYGWDRVIGDLLSQSKTPNLKITNFNDAYHSNPNEVTTAFITKDPSLFRLPNAAYDPFRRTAATAAAMGVAAPDLLAKEKKKAVGGKVKMAGGLTHTKKVKRHGNTVSN